MDRKDGPTGLRTTRRQLLLGMALATAGMAATALVPRATLATMAPRQLGQEGGAVDLPPPPGPEPAWVTKGLQKLEQLKSSGIKETMHIKLALSPYQDVLSTHIGLQKGWWRENGIELELVPAGWPEATAALAAGAVESGNGCEGEVMLQYQKVRDLRYANELYIWQGSNIIVRPNEGYKTYWDFINEGMSHEEAVKAVGQQLRGKTVNAEGAGVVQQIRLLAEKAGVDFDKEVKHIDMEASEGLAAFLSGTGDFYSGGIPQRTRAEDEGMVEIITNKELNPEGLIHCGFVVRQPFVDEHFDLLVRWQHVIYKEMQYIQENPQDGLGIIVQKVVETTPSTNMTVDRLRGIWNNWELFPSTPKEAWDLTVPEDARYYWKPRWVWAANDLKKRGILNVDPNFEEITVWPWVCWATWKVYGPTGTTEPIPLLKS